VYEQRSLVSGIRPLIKKILSVGGWTLVSRITGFLRDVVMAAILGTGPVADAFVVALRLPNHFRAIFGEGAFNTAFVPAYARIREQNGAAAADLFQGRIFTLMVVVQLVVLLAAMVFMTDVVRLLAPGFAADAGQLKLAVDLTTITFPYLLLITLVTLYAGVLNGVGRFAAAAAAPILLNIGIVVALLVAGLFQTPGHAAAWGVLVAGVAELLMLVWFAWRAGVLARPAALRFDADVKGFFKALGPATIGSMGVQIAMFADTIIATLLPIGAVSALYYADRLYQLPIGVIGVAAGTVLLPEMSRLLAAGRPDAAQAAQHRAMTFSLFMAAPFFAAFLVVPDLIMHAFFARGAFTVESADAAGAALLAYAVGLPAVVLIRSAAASFFAKGDTTTPLWASLAGVAVNVGLKIVLTGPLLQAGLALATSIGAWVNLVILLILALRGGAMVVDRRFVQGIGVILCAAIAMAATIALTTASAADFLAVLPRERELATLALLGVGGGLVYLLFIAVGWRLGLVFQRGRPNG
jgi:putative peptidoglycan lipid II flippase